MSLRPSDRLIELLNTLINGELRSSHLYWQSGAWCADNNLTGCQEFFLNHADEELVHMRKLLDYMIDIDCPIRFSGLPTPEVPTGSIKDLLSFALQHEKDVTDTITAVVAECQQTHEHGTFQFLQWFIMEQREELKTFRDLVDRTALIGDGPQALYFIDQEVARIGQRAATAAAAPAAV